MHRRRFLKNASQLGVGLGVTGPLLGKGSHALAERSTGNRPQDRPTEGRAPTLVTSLDGEWLTATDPDNIGRERQWISEPVSQAEKTRVPSIIQETFPAYHGVLWYWRDFVTEAHPYHEGRYLLRFNAVDYLADVWVNGTHIGQHEGGGTPFVLDATGAVRPGAGNRIAVRVLNPGDDRIDGIVLRETPHGNKTVKFMNGSMYDYGGITEPVELILVPAVRIEDLHIVPDWKTGMVAIHANLRNLSGSTQQARIYVAVAPITGQTLLADTIDVDLAAGDTVVNHEIEVKNYHLWDLDEPNLYNLTARIEAPGVNGSHEHVVRFGFRDFRVVNGYFRLNGKRIFLRSTHTGNHVPLGQIVPPPGFPDMLRRDLWYLKSSGFNTVRFISGIAHPYQLDLCDEMGLLVYEEHSGSWLLKDSPQMKTRFERSLRDVILRDRNHPSVVIWSTLNETADGPVSREAVSALPLVRSIDKTRLVLFSSGRFDGHLEIGSVSNPGSSTWEHVWGKEAVGAPLVAMKYPSGLGSGDFHSYPKVPQTTEADQLIRTLGEDSKPVFLSEYGIGSMMNVIHEARMYEQAGVRSDAEDYVLTRSMADRLTADWMRFGMDTVYPFPESMLHDSQSHMARHRLLGFNTIRSNPKLCGFNLTGMLDHALTGEGVWRFWRDWKPGAFDAMQDGWAPVRWCLFVNPTHTYVGRPVKLEAVLANEDALRPGEYPTRFRAWGKNGVIWERLTSVNIPNVGPGEDGPLAVPVLKEEVVLNAPAGTYKFGGYIERAIAPPESSWEFHLSDAASLPRVEQKVTTWGVPANVEQWLKSHGVAAQVFSGGAAGRREIILVGDVSKSQDATDWRELASRMATGSTVVFLSPGSFKRSNDSAGWLPLAKKGRVYEFNDWLYHKECVAKPHPIFEGLQGNGILDWYYYGPVLPHYLFDGQETPADVFAAAFAAGYSTPGGYASGILMGTYKFGAGQFIVNTFPILDHINSHPAADRLLLNIILYASGSLEQPVSALPSDFTAQLKTIGYTD